MKKVKRRKVLLKLQIKRIRSMEKIFDEAKMLMDAAEENPSKLIEYQPEISKLAEYYESAQWKSDFEDDEAGKLPKKLKRGVLSEDGIYDLLERNGELIR